MTISSPGIGSGLDVNSIVSQLMAIERQPITDLQTKSAKLDTQISEFGKLKSAISTFRDAALKLTKSDTLGMTVGTSSDSASVAVTAQSGAAVGSYSLQVTALAKAQSLASGVFASANAAPGAGTLHIELGAWGTGQTAFTPKSGATAVDIAVTATDTLTQVRDKINAANAGVTALIFTDASGSRLLMRSTATGVANAFRTSVTDADGNNADATGLSALAFDPSASASVMTQTEAAADAAATLNGLPIASPSNTLTNVVDGVTLTLGKLTTGPVDINVVQDNTSLKAAVQSFADAYNALNTLIAGEVKYDPTSKTGGPLQGDSTAVGLQRQLRMMMGSSSGASSVFARLSEVGLELQKDGTVSVNATKLDSALTNLPELKKLLANTDSLVPGNNGIARQFSTMGDALLSIDGVITTRTDGLSKRKDLNQAQQDALDQRATQTEARLRAQYTALDVTIGQMSSLSQYVTQQMAIFTNSTKA
jgi:flagellar hook-associated protein 2